MRALLLVALLLAAPATTLRAQQEPEPPSPWRPLRIAKWSAVTASAAAALYGLSTNIRADAAFERIEEGCVTAPDRCARRLPDGAYADVALEQEYQRVRSLDGHVRRALIGSRSVLRRVSCCSCSTCATSARPTTCPTIRAGSTSGRWATPSRSV